MALKPVGSREQCAHNLVISGFVTSRVEVEKNLIICLKFRMVRFKFQLVIRFFLKFEVMEFLAGTVFIS